MGRSKRDDAAVIERLEELYARIPTVRCQGRCQHQCTSIAMSDVEHRRIRRRGVVIPPITDATLGQPCPALNAEGRCNVYAERPFICRAYGASPGLPCDFACEVEGAPLSDIELFELMDLSYRVGGSATRNSAHKAMDLLITAAKRDPEIAKRLRVYMMHGKDVPDEAVAGMMWDASLGGYVEGRLDNVFRWHQGGVRVTDVTPTPLGIPQWRQAGEAGK